MKKFTLFIISFLTWCVLTWAPDQIDIVIGAVICLGLSATLGDIIFVDWTVVLNFRRFLYFIYFLIVFLYEFTKANFILAFEVLRFWGKFETGMIKIKTALARDAEITFLMNAITFMPATLALDYKNGYMHIHYINISGFSIAKAERRVFKRVEGIIKGVFE